MTIIMSESRPLQLTASLCSKEPPEQRNLSGTYSSRVTSVGPVSVCLAFSTQAGLCRQPKNILLTRTLNCHVFAQHYWAGHSLTIAALTSLSVWMCVFLRNSCVFFFWIKKTGVLRCGISSFPECTHTFYFEHMRTYSRVFVWLVVYNMLITLNNNNTLFVKRV